MSEKQHKWMKSGMAVILLGTMLLLSKKTAEILTVGSSKTIINAGKSIVVIDAGHGGKDPGKVGVNNVREKDINLAIARKVKKYLELSDIEVFMTREEDQGLYEENSPNKKVQDLKNRVEIMNGSSADLVISIHQNAYGEESVSGPQVFFYHSSAEGKKAAEIMQKTIMEVIKPQKNREIKANRSYYLLKKTKPPIIIVECGFLSNQEDASNLMEETYRDRIAWAICRGTLRYVKGNNGK